MSRTMFDLLTKAVQDCGSRLGNYETGAERFMQRGDKEALSKAHAAIATTSLHLDELKELRDAAEIEFIRFTLTDRGHRVSYLQQRESGLKKEIEGLVKQGVEVPTRLAKYMRLLKRLHRKTLQQGNDGPLTEFDICSCSPWNECPVCREPDPGISVKSVSR